ncbi:MAG: hypothetical protein PGN07_11955 [Aeromicrobium erythreum]
MALSRPEITKDVVQQCAEAALGTGGQVAAILFDAARRVTSELGAFGTEVFEIVEASRRAGDDDTHPRAD